MRIFRVLTRWWWQRFFHVRPYLGKIPNTPPKINIEPENDGLEDDFPFPGWYSQVPC